MTDQRVPRRPETPEEIADFARREAATAALSHAESVAYCEALCDQRADQLPDAPAIHAYIKARSTEYSIHVPQHRSILFARMTSFLDGFLDGQEFAFRLGYQAGLDDAAMLAAKGGEA